jgi:allophanate hydrolase
MNWDGDTGSLGFTTLHGAYRSGATTPEQVVRAVYARIARRDDDKVWIDLVPELEAVTRARDLTGGAAEGLPLYGLPFAIKDNIDLAGRPTTAACPAFAYTPQRSATAVERLIAAGAIPIGKTNLDQFATGLLGTLSPYGAPRSLFDDAYITGGSSSGSAVAVAAGLVSFALGTDTAGSGRVPAAFNNIVGLKPTRGLVSTAGVVPACRTLDCVSVFALSCDDAWAVFDVIQGFDPADAFSRFREEGMSARPAQIPVGFRFGVPDDRALRFFGDAEAERLYHHALDRLEQLGGRRVVIDHVPFAETAALLYGGPWVAERYAAIAELIAGKPEVVYPVTRQIISAATRYTAVDVFKAQYQLAELRAATAPTWQMIDVLALPTAPTIFRLEQVAENPLACNSALGTYTNFVNLLDLAAIAVPTAFDTRGLPFGISLIGPAFSDHLLCALGEALHTSANLPMGATGHALPPRRPLAAVPRGHAIAVVGAHLSGMRLNRELVARGATLLRAARTAPSYRLYALGTTPPKPGLKRVRNGGQAIEVEVWNMPSAQVGRFLIGIPSPLALGQLELDDGSWVTGFVCEPWALAGATDITAYGGWRAYVAAR